ncbi:MAG: hypothetical protein JO247_21455 [Chloroflexi bacterium]|nr:hypothetical protein [Chloroflexota bacterium]
MPLVLVVVVVEVLPVEVAPTAEERGEALLAAPTALLLLVPEMSPELDAGEALLAAPVVPLLVEPVAPRLLDGLLVLVAVDVVEVDDGVRPVSRISMNTTRSPLVVRLMKLPARAWSAEPLRAVGLALEVVVAEPLLEVDGAANEPLH